MTGYTRRVVLADEEAICCWDCDDPVHPGQHIYICIDCGQVACTPCLEAGAFLHVAFLPPQVHRSRLQAAWN